MKKLIAILLAVAMLFALAACAKDGESEQDVGVPNPMSEVSADDMEFSINVPENASDVKFFIIDDGSSKINQMTYTLDGKEYCYRMQFTDETAAYDMSGIYSDKWENEDTAVSYCDAVAMTCSEGSVIYWMDVVPGVNYTLSCAQQLSAAELSAAAEQLFAPMQGDAEGDEEMPAIAEGHYEDGDFDTVDLEYAGMGVYQVTIGIYRLSTFEGEGRWEEDSVKFTVEAPDGSSITGRFFPSVDGDDYSLSFTDSQWDLLESGALFEGFVLMDA